MRSKPSSTPSALTPSSKASSPGAPYDIPARRYFAGCACSREIWSDYVRAPTTVVTTASLTEVRYRRVSRPSRPNNRTDAPDSPCCQGHPIRCPSEVSSYRFTAKTARCHPRRRGHHDPNPNIPEARDHQAGRARSVRGLTYPECRGLSTDFERNILESGIGFQRIDDAPCQRIVWQHHILATQGFGHRATLDNLNHPIP